jgi:Ankyrin repeats (many copies)
MMDPQPQILQSKPSSRFWIIGAIIVTGLLWGLSLALPVWDTRAENTGDWDVVPGLVPALIGWLGLLVKCPAWFANPLLVVICVMFCKGRKAGFFLTLVALALAASAYMFPAIYGDNDDAVVESRRIGFYLWLGSFVTIATAYALLAPATNGRLTVARVAVVALMVVGIVGLERMFPVGVSPLEAALKNPNDRASLAAALATHPSETEKNAALRWAMRQDLSDGREVPSQHVVMLLAAGANPNQSDSGYIPLMETLGRSKASEALAGLLVKSGADVNTRDKQGKTVLMWALPPYGSEATVELFVKAGADVNARDEQGKTVMDIARENDSGPECEKFLMNAGARPGR